MINHYFEIKRLQEENKKLKNELIEKNQCEDEVDFRNNETLEYTHDILFKKNMNTIKKDIKFKNKKGN